MTSNGLAETSNHIQYNPTTYTKGRYAYIFQGQRNGFQSGGAKDTAKYCQPPWLTDKKEF